MSGGRKNLGRMIRARRDALLETVAPISRKLKGSITAGRVGSYFANRVAELSSNLQLPTARLRIEFARLALPH